MRVIKIFLIILFLNLCAFKGFSQYYYYNDRYYDNDLLFEFGGSLGGMNCQTDVGGANSDKTYYFNEIRLKNTKLSTGVYASIMYKDVIGLRLEATFGGVAAADSDVTSKSSLNLTTKNQRNLSFRSDISEVALMVEFHPLMLKYYEDGPPSFSPYIIAGIGWFNFNPQTKYNGTWVDLKNYHTEGEGFAEYKNIKPYRTSQANIPFGIGVRYELSSFINLRLEYIHRKLFTDYLDDASSKFYINPSLFSKYLSPVDARYATALFNRRTDGKTPARRGNPNDKDAYMTLSLKLGITLGRSSVK